MKPYIIQDLKTKTGEVQDARKIGPSSAGGAVSSVNGQTGAVVLDADDVGAVPVEDALFDGGVVGLKQSGQGDQIYAQLDTHNVGTPPVLLFGDYATDDPINIRGVATPVYNSDAANKAYVDALRPATVAVSGTTPTIEPAANTIYNCGELTSLTISNPTATGAYSIVFTSGATPTATVIPPKPAMLWQTDDNEPPQGFPAANTLYEINVKDTRVVLGEWPVPEVSA